jgi:hypothetical protein
MSPTNKLRWVKCNVRTVNSGVAVLYLGDPVNILRLQQWWEEEWANHVVPVGNEVSGEWRDVPVETE